MSTVDHWLSEIEKRGYSWVWDRAYDINDLDNLERKIIQKALSEYDLNHALKKRKIEIIFRILVLFSVALSLSAIVISLIGFYR